MSFPILYSKTTTDFSNLGLGILADAIDVKITEELNGAFELDMVYLARGILHEQLVYDAIIKTDTGDQSSQLFRIKKITKTIDKRLNIHAEHVSYVMNDYPVSVSNLVSNSTAQTALNAWKSSIESVIGSSSGLTVYSDITTANDAKWTIDMFNNARDVLGGVEGSILDTWGGEFKFDNYRVNLLKQRGTTRDTIIAYGRNLTDLQQDESILETYTSVYPFATVNVKGTKNKADYTVIKTLPEKYVDSSYVNNYPMRRFLAVDFSDKFDDDKNKYSDASLRSLAQKYITSNKIGIPDVSITASVVDLEKAMNGGGSVERIDLGDIVQLNFTDVGINTSVEIVGTIYDVLRERYSEYTLGARKRTFSSIITGQINDVKKSVTRAQSDVISALISADGKSTNYYGSAEPTSPQEGDQWFWQDGPNSGIKQWHDGAWIDLVDTNTQAEIANSVTQAVAQAQSMDAALNQSINDSINETMTTVNTSLAVLDSEAAVFKSEADSALQAASTSLAAYASSATASANKALSSAATAASSASAALSQAGVNSLATSSVASDVNGLKASYTSLNSSAGVLTSQTASLAVSASSASAQFDKVSSTTGSLATETAALKVSASSASAEFTKVNSSAGSLATQAASLAVSASSAALSIGNMQSSAGSLSAQTASLAVSASSFATTVSKQADSISSVTTRIQTAEGSISAAQNNITGLQSSQTQTANQLQTEITDRNTGDANTLTQAKSFTTSQIATYDTGIQSQFTQTSNSFIATLSAINQVIDSSLTNGLDMWRLVDRNNNASQSRFYKTSNVSIEGVASVGYNQSALSGDYTSISTQMMSKNGWQSSILNVSVDAQVRTLGGTDTDYFIIYLSEWDDSGTQIAVTSITGTITTAFSGTKNFRKTITLNANTTKVMLTYQMRGNGNVYVARPYVGANELPAGAYVEGPATNSIATLALMQNNYTFGINSNGVLVSGIMGNEKQVTLAGNAIHLDGNTTVSGDFYALGGNFKNLNASEIKTGTINASLINVINLNASNITTGKLNALLLTGNTGYLGTVNTGRVVNSQDNHLQLASYGFYDTTNDRAQVELLNNDSAISAEMRGSFNYYGNPTDKGNGLGIRMKYNQILAIDESGGSKNLYLSPYAGGQVRIVSRDLSTYYDIAAANFKVSSQRKFKENITSFPDGALDIVNNTTIRQYTKNGVDEIGVITDEAPKELISSTGEFVSIYDYVSILYKAVQELSTQVNELNRRPNNAT